MIRGPICPYCQKPSVLVTGERIYPYRKDLWEGSYYFCRPCNSYVGCHRRTTIPLGELANEPLRKLRKAAHDRFDPVWSSGAMSRKKAYLWLANRLAIRVADCHIGMFDLEQCRQVIKICGDYPLREFPSRRVK